VCTRFLFDSTNTLRTALMVYPPVCEPPASGPVMTDYAPWHLVTHWSSGGGISSSLKAKTIAPTVRVPGVNLEAAFSLQHFGLLAPHTLSPSCFASSLAQTCFLFTIPYLMHIDLTTCSNL